MASDSLELQDGQRIFSDEIKKVILKDSDNSILEKRIPAGELNRILINVSGGDGSGWG